MGYAINANIEGCAFIGKLLGGSSNTCGGLLGYKSNTSGSSVTIKNCLFLPTEVTVGTCGSYTFGAGTTSLVTVTNSFYSQTLGDAQGTKAYTVQSGTDVLTLDYGSGTNYGNITTYNFDQDNETSAAGLLYDSKLYTSGTTKVTFTPEASNGLKPTLSTTSGTLAEGNDGTWTLTMVSANASRHLVLELQRYALRSPRRQQPDEHHDDSRTRRPYSQCHYLGAHALQGQLVEHPLPALRH